MVGGEATLDDVLVVQRETQTVRAVEPRTGQEKWNFSVSQHNLDLSSGMADLCPQQNEEEAYLQHTSASGEVFKAVVSDGVICSVEKAAPDVIRWSRNFKSPIVHAWHLVGGRLVKVDLFSSSALPNKRKNEDGLQPPPALYVGTHNRQLYIQESRGMEEARVHAGLEGDPALHTPPRVAWRPYLISSASRTPVINHGAPAAVDSTSLPLLTHDDSMGQNTALAIFYGGEGEYPFDSGLYLFPEEPDLDYDPILDYHDANDSGLDDDDQGDNEDQDELPPILGDSQVVQIVFVSLWYWWREVVLISVVTALILNLAVTRPIIRRLRLNFRQRLDQMARRRPVSVTLQMR